MSPPQARTRTRRWPEGHRGPSPKFNGTRDNLAYKKARDYLDKHPDAEDADVAREAGLSMFNTHDLTLLAQVRRDAEDGWSLVD